MTLRFWDQWSHSTVLIFPFQKQNLKNLKRRTKNDFHKIRHTAQTLMPQGFWAFFAINRVQKRIQAKALCCKAFRALGVDLWDVAQKPKVRHVHIFYSSKPNHPLPPLPQRLHPRFWLLVFQPTTLALLLLGFGRCFSIALFPICCFLLLLFQRFSRACFVVLRALFRLLCFIARFFFSAFGFSTFQHSTPQNRVLDFAWNTQKPRDFSVRGSGFKVSSEYSHRRFRVEPLRGTPPDGVYSRHEKRRPEPPFYLSAVRFFLFLNRLHGV